MENKLFWTGWIFLFILPCSPFLQTTTIENKDSLTIEEEMELYETMEMEAELLDTFEVKEVEEYPEEETIFKIVEELPRYFKECDPKKMSRREMKQCHEDQFLKTIYEYLEYPKFARELKIEGEVIAQFVVEKDGFIQDVKILKDIGGGCGDEVKRVFQKINQSREVAKWTPGKARGKPVKIRFTLPIEFKL